MQPPFLRKITVTSAGTPVRLLADPAVRVCAILVASIPGLTGNLYRSMLRARKGLLTNSCWPWKAPGTLCAWRTISWMRR